MINSPIFNSESTFQHLKNKNTALQANGMIIITNYEWIIASKTQLMVKHKFLLSLTTENIRSTKA